MNLDAIVTILVGILRVHTLCQRRKGIGQTAIFLQFLTFLGFQFTLAGNVFQSLVYIDITSGLIQQSATSIKASLNIANHLSYSRELDNGLTKLLTIASIGNRFIICGLRKTNRLSCNTQASTIHQGHNVLDQSKLAIATKFTLGILINKFAGWTSMNTEFVLDTAHIDSAIAFVIDKHRQTTTITRASFRAGKNEVNVGVTIGDKAFRAIQTPAIVLFIIGCLKHHALQVTTSIGFSEIHRHGLACTNTRNILPTLFFIAKAIEGLDAVLQTPNVLEASIASRNDFISGSINGYRHV